MTLLVLLWRETRRGYAHGGAGITVAFFLLIATLFPLAIGPDQHLLSRIGGGIIWTAALLAALLPVERLTGPDINSGIFDQLAVRGYPLAMVNLLRIAGHWLGFAPPLMAATVIVAALLDLPSDAILRAEAGLLLGTPGLAALAIAISAIVSGLRGAAAIAGLLMLPLAVPFLIFGAGELAGGAGAFKLLAATSLLFVAGAPVVAAAAIRSRGE